MKKTVAMFVMFVVSAFAVDNWLPYTFWEANDVRLQLPANTFGGAVRHAVVYGYGFINNGTLIFGQCSFKTVGTCSGRGCQPPVTDHPTLCVWDFSGNVQFSIPGTVTPNFLPVSDFTYPLCTDTINNQPQPCRFPPGYGITRIVEWASDGVQAVGGNVVYGNTTYDVTGFVHPVTQ